MPMQSKSRKTGFRKKGYGYTRRHPRRKSNRNFGDKPSKIVVKGPTAVTDECFVALRYADTISLSSTVAPAHHRFQSSLFKPDREASGHQPLGYDEWSLFYQSYIVFGIGWTITFIGDGSQTGICSVVPKATDAVSTVMNTIREKAYENTAILGLQGSAKHIRTLSGYMSTKKIFGLDRLGSQNADYGAGVGGTPTQPWYLHLSAQAQDRNSSMTVPVEVQLTYYCKFYKRKGLTQS